MDNFEPFSCGTVVAPAVSRRWDLVEHAALVQGAAASAAPGVHAQRRVGAGTVPAGLRPGALPSAGLSLCRPRGLLPRGILRNQASPCETYIRMFSFLVLQLTFEKLCHDCLAALI